MARLPNGVETMPKISTPAE